MSQYGPVGIALDYAMEKAPRDVRNSLDWLSTVGFEVRAERGGRGEAFGNVLLDWERPPIAIRVVRDRSQWELKIAPNGADLVGLQILLNAEEGGEFVLVDHDLGDPLSEVPPEGVEWTVAVPRLLSWLHERDRSQAIGEAQARAQAAVTAQLARWQGRSSPS